jgi:hypothetical protein
MNERESGASALVGEPQRGLSTLTASNNSLDRRPLRQSFILASMLHAAPVSSVVRRFQ